MPTSKYRLNISLPSDVREALAKVSQRDKVPQATKAARLLETALELEEDQIWHELATRRDKKNGRFISHDQAWS